jgi:cytidyltransferase-like protein
MALQNLKTYYSESNTNDFQTMLKLPCVVTEKLQASSFHVQSTVEGYNYFKSGSKKPMNAVDRTIVKYYESAISHFDSISEDSKEEMPKDWKFGFDYMTDSKTVNIKYDRIPKNNLMLTHIQVLNPADHSLIKKVIRDPKILNKWADVLEVQRPQVLFSGSLNEFQREQLSELMALSDAEYGKVFEDITFSRKMYNIFNPSMNSTALNEGLDGTIDSIVINFFDSTSVKNFKICEDVLIKKEEREPSHMYQLSLLDLVEYFTTYDIESIELNEEKADQRYIELISKLFNAYVSENASKYVGVTFDSADFASSPEFKLNTKFIKNEKTIEYVSNEVLEELYKIALGSFRKRRVKETQIINADLMRQINEIVGKIDNSIMAKSNEASVMTFKTYLQNQGLKHQESPITEALNVKYPEQQKLVNMFVGRFQPFTLGHAKVLETIHKQNGHPVVIFLIKAKTKKKEDAFSRPYDEETQIKMLNKLKAKYPIEKVYVLPTAGIDHIFNAMRADGYEPVLWGTGTDRLKTYSYQVDKPVYREDLGVRTDFGLFEIPRTGKNISATQVRNAMLAGDEKLFKKLTPKEIHGMYDELKVKLEQSMAANESSLLTFNEFIKNI